MLLRLLFFPEENVRLGFEMGGVRVNWHGCLNRDTEQFTFIFT